MGVKSSKIILNYALRTKGNEQTVICSASVRGGGGVLINKHELVIITGIFIDCPRKYVAEFINILSRLLTTNAVWIRHQFQSYIKPSEEIKPGD